HPSTGRLQTRWQKDRLVAWPGDVRKFNLLGGWVGTVVFCPCCRVGRYGTAAGGCNGANYLIDLSKDMITKINEGRWSQDKVETPASVLRE
ncbi:MAG: hypothetical protein KA240_18865, partial [Nitrospira sp.]|nr:hypothetical protein [Nitrospira sp.]